VPPAVAVVALQRLDLLADRARLLLRVPAGGDLHLLARLVLGAQGLAEPALVVGDQVRGGGQDMGGRAVIALEPDDLSAREVFLEAQDVIDLGAAPTVDRLVVVADAADVFEGARRGRGIRAGLIPGLGRKPASPESMIAVGGYGFRARAFGAPRNDVGAWGGTRALPQQPQPQILRDVGVLVLVHQNVLEPRLVLPQHLGLLAEQPDAFQQQVAEVGGVEHLQPVLERRIELLALAVCEARGLAGRHLLRGQAAVLPAVEQAGEHARRPALLVDVLGFE
jgi:hypothetical protein